MKIYYGPYYIGDWKGRKTRLELNQLKSVKKTTYTNTEFRKLLLQITIIDNLVKKLSN